MTSSDEPLVQGAPPLDPHAEADALQQAATKDIEAERAEAEKIGERLDALEKDVFPERPQPATPGQAIGT